MSSEYRQSHSSWYRTVALLLLAAIVPTSGQQIGIDICSCAPSTYEFKFDFSLYCPPINITEGDAVASTNCMVSPYDDPSVGDLVPVAVQEITVLELDQDLDAIVREPITGNFKDGDTFSYTSVAAEPGAIVDPKLIPRAIQFIITGVNILEQPLRNIVYITFSNSCQAYPVLIPGQYAGWVRFIELQDPVEDYCPLAPDMPSAAPTPGTPFPSPVATRPPTVMSMSMSLDYGMLDMLDDEFGRDYGCPDSSKGSKKGKSGKGGKGDSSKSGKSGKGGEAKGSKKLGKGGNGKGGSSSYSDASVDSSKSGKSGKGLKRRNRLLFTKDESFNSKGSKKIGSSSKGSKKTGSSSKGTKRSGSSDDCYSKGKSGKGKGGKGGKGKGESSSKSGKGSDGSLSTKSGKGKGESLSSKDGKGHESRQTKGSKKEGSESGSSKYSKKDGTGKGSEKLTKKSGSSGDDSKGKGSESTDYGKGSAKGHSSDSGKGSGKGADSAGKGSKKSGIATGSSKGENKLSKKDSDDRR